MSRPMSVEERTAFLLHGTRTGKLATVRLRPEHVVTEAGVAD